MIQRTVTITCGACAHRSIRRSVRRERSAWWNCSDGMKIGNGWQSSDTRRGGPEPTGPPLLVGSDHSLFCLMLMRL